VVHPVCRNDRQGSCFGLKPDYRNNIVFRSIVQIKTLAYLKHLEHLQLSSPRTINSLLCTNSAPPSDAVRFIRQMV
jgi:hypothetical protein